MLKTNLPEPRWAAFVAIDWGDQKHCWKLCLSGDEKVFETGELCHKPEALNDWAMSLEQRFGGRPVAVCLEQSRGALSCALLKYSFLHLFPVHPATSARYRQAFRPSGPKSDPGDTSLLLDLLLHHRDQLRQLEPDTPQTRELQALVEDRRGFVNQRTRLSNNLTAVLKRYFPQALEIVDNIDSPMGCDLLQRWPSLSTLQSAREDTLRKFFTSHNSRSESRISSRIEAIRTAVAVTNDPAELSTGMLKTRHLAAMLKQLNTTIQHYDDRIASAVVAHPETRLFQTLPGAGAAMLPRLVAAFGTQRHRFNCALDLASYCGIAPVTQQSGKSCLVRLRRSCPKFLRQTFHEYAQHSLAKCVWARAYYEAQLARNKQHQAIVRALAYKWIRILFRCWKQGVPYDESVYLASLVKRGSSLSPLLPPDTLVEWQSAAGFSHLVLKKHLTD
jgi:transposase